MTTKVLEAAELEMEALSLIDFLDSHLVNGALKDEAVIYVQDDEGRTFERVCLVAETLTDGSVVYNLILA